MTTLVTGEAVALELRPAGVPSRMLAAGLDGILQIALLFGGFALLGATASSVSSAATAAMSIVLLVLVTIGYPVGFESLLRGRTLGKMAFGLRVVRDDGGPIGFRHALVRGLAGAFLERPGITFFAVGVITMALNSASKRVGDLLAGTVVLQERVAVRGGQVATMPRQLAGWAAGCDLSGLTDELALSVRQFLARSADLTDDARNELGGRLLDAVSSVVTPPPPPGTPGWAVLSAVLAERRRREEARLGSPAGAAAPTLSGWAPASPAAPWTPPPPVTPPAETAPERPPPEPGPGGFVLPG